MDLKDSLTRDILNSISEGLFTVDKNFKINFFNKAAERITGYQQENVLGKFCKYICRSDLCMTKCPMTTVLESGKSVKDLEGTIKNQNGRPIYIRLNATILEGNDENPVGGVISFQDISELHNLKNPTENGRSFHGMIGHGKRMQEIFELIDEISDSDASVLIQGESGTGKEMIANAIQQTSQRRDQEFIKINCSVFSPQLLASELFGHVKGAFTGAIKDRPGRFEIADKGTLFLDEIAEMSAEMQIQLLRVLQEGGFERVGESITRYTDVRVIAATNRNLESMLKSDRFREDLYYRLNVIPIFVPPIRHRTEDVPFLIKHFLTKFSRIYDKPILDIDNEMLDAFIRYSWPGNIRELENAIEHAFALTKSGSRLEWNKLPVNIRENIPGRGQHQLYQSANGEVIRILDLLEKHHWNRTKVSKILGIGRTTLWRKLREYQIESPAL